MLDSMILVICCFYRKSKDIVKYIKTVFWLTSEAFFTQSELIYYALAFWEGPIH